ncbi:MAG: DNA repair exonuclease [Wenzhouxiangellaceae bacterium]|nr:DNA repair exonuclease [Wenzhouxiangellaceae bacterium]
MPLKLLAVGDLHLGRTPAGVPSVLGESVGRLGPDAAWRRVVDTAIAESVHAVALAGDLVDHDQDFFEAQRLLAAGIERLLEHGIAVFAVAGNHDVDVLPRLARTIPGLQLLGAGGRWQREQLEAGGETLSLHGWSFPARHVHGSPLERGQPESGPGVNLGLLHCDLDASGSRYAPVARAALQSTGLDGWLLGHIHKPGALEAPNPIGYLGSVSALHPGETGPRGPWCVTITNGRIESVDQQVLAPLRWQPLSLDLSGIEQASEAEDRLLERIVDLERELDRCHQPPLAVGLRLTLTGRTGLTGAAVEQLRQAATRNLAGRSHRQVFIDRLLAATRPEQALERLAKRNDPIGMAAQRLLLLDQQADDPARRRLVEAAWKRAGRLAAESRWNGARPLVLDEAFVVEQLRDVGVRLLDRMLAQQARPDA